ncbi:MAG TPA: 6-phosphogluconolactonase [Thermoanaerobaculia bacterium]|nr:6-phosphogluconolactonase [Thermoanaerobaculia bacterium]
MTSGGEGEGRLPGRVRVFPTPEALANAAAAMVAGILREAIAARGRASLVLAGGSTPRPVYRRLAGRGPGDVSAGTSLPGDGRRGGGAGADGSAATFFAVDWRRVEVFYGDERAVPPDDPASNHRMARETLLDHVPVPGEAVHRVRGELGPEEAAAAYERELVAALGEAPRFDLVLLGLGGDGHTASLFPGDVAGEDRVPPGRLVAAATAPVVPRQRVTLTYRALAAARSVLFLVEGAGKAAMVARVLSGDLALPATRVRPAAGEPLWFLDAAAAAELSPEEGR